MDHEFDDHHSERIPVKKAFLWVFLSILAISGTATFGWLYYLHWKEALQTNNKYLVTVIAQTAPHNQHLDNSFFAEVLGLSVDYPTNLYALNNTEAENKLRSHPLIKKAKIEKVAPSTLHIDYELRNPVAYLGDFVNVALDEEGVMIPFQPFFTPKKLPKLYLGLDDSIQWGDTLSSHQYRICCELLNQFQEHSIEVKSIDVSRIEASSYGPREIIVLIEEKIETEGRFMLAPRYLRLNHLDYKTVLANYFQLREHNLAHSSLSDTLRQPVATIDLRIKDLAFIIDEK